MFWGYVRSVLMAMVRGRSTTTTMYSRGPNRRHGVGIMLSPKLAVRVDGTNFKSERVLNITLKLKSRNVSIIQIYAPQQGRPNNEKEAF